MSVLKQIFGPSRVEIWRQLCEQTGANLVKGGFLKGPKVEATHGDWTVTLDIQVVAAGKTVTRFTRIRAPYVNPDGFRFSISRRNVFSDLGKLLGLQDVEVGHAEFDRDFIIKGNDEAKLRALFANAKIRELITAQPRILFGVKDDEGWFAQRFPEGVDELHFRVLGVTKDVKQLKQLYELFAETLEELCRLGSAKAGDPKVKL